MRWYKRLVHLHDPAIKDLELVGREVLECVRPHSRRRVLQIMVKSLPVHQAVDYGELWLAVVGVRVGELSVDVI